MGLRGLPSDLGLMHLFPALGADGQSSPTHPGSSSLLVIQVHGSNIATSEERVANWKILVNQWRNEHSLRDELNHHLVFTKNDEEPGNFGVV
jgi:hypothetical protein